MICAHAVSVAFKKVQGVQSVDISLNKGLATLKLTPGNAVHVEDLWDSIRKNGFTPKETKVTVRGELLSSGGKPQLKVSGTNQTYDLVSRGQPVPDLTARVGQVVVIDGVMTPSNNKKGATPIQVTGLK